MGGWLSWLTGWVSGGRLTAEGKHGLHVAALLSWLAAFEVLTGGVRWAPEEGQEVEPIERYGWLGATLLYLLRAASLLVLPQCLFNFAGLVFSNAFREKVSLKGSPLLAPFLCIRVVTRGDYPQLVQDNVRKNIATCLKAGIENFYVEVVTDKAVNLAKDARTREVVVPTSYQTKSGALFKARALQYCLEDDVNVLRDEDWILHLDEETLLTEDSACGVLNFCMDGKHHFGQGLITYANGPIVNWVTTLSDSFRVADDMGKLRFQLSRFHKPIFGWKGSFVVTSVGAERKVSFDHGLDGSIAEDCFFAMVAMRDGYSFDFVQGAMQEKSPFSLWDFLQQRKRWLQGIFLVVHSGEIPWRNKFWLACSLYAWAGLPLTTSNVVLAGLMPLPRYVLFDFLVAFVGALNLYMYVFGVAKSFGRRERGRPWHLLLFMLGALATIPFNVAIENAAVVWGMLGRKHTFFVVQKQLPVHVV